MANEEILTQQSFRRGIVWLVDRDKHLADVIARYGPPPFWVHASGFPGLVLAVLAQQVSLESADAAYRRLLDELGSIEPGPFAALNDTTLKAIGFSRQKASYVRGLASDLIKGRLDLAALTSMDDESARSRLIQIRGVGPWTADAYLLFSLRRRDAWPPGDLALARAIQDLRGLDETPTPDAADRMAEGWRPWRAVAARILWHQYLSLRGRSAAI